jgi:hypothetical protein
MRRRDLIAVLGAAAWPLAFAGIAPIAAAERKRPGRPAACDKKRPRRYGAMMKKNITALAARNNALWCDAVCRAHDRPGEFHDTLWLSRLGAPRFYPDAVTLSDVESAPAQMETIAALVGSTREREWAVQDSFQALELNSLGFEPLFDAEWVAMNPPLPDLKGHPAAEYRSASVTSEAGLIAWEQAWAGEEVNAAAVSKPRVFMPRLLTDTGVRFVLIQGYGGIVGGGILNRGSEVVGLSNLFGCIDMEMVWRNLVAMAAEVFPGLPLVGYERGHDLAVAHQTGFETVGLLRVWKLGAGVPWPH